MLYFELSANAFKSHGIDEEKLKQLAGKTPEGEINWETISKAGERATSMIDPYCYAQYSNSMPFNPVPGIIRDLALSLTLHYLYEGKQSLTEDRQKTFEMNMKILQDIREGKTRLFSESQPVSSNPVIFSKKTNADRVFFKLEGY